MAVELKLASSPGVLWRHSWQSRRGSASTRPAPVPTLPGFPGIHHLVHGKVPAKRGHLGPDVQRPDYFIRWIRHHSRSKICFMLNGFRTLPNFAVVRVSIFACTRGNIEIFVQIETVRWWLIHWVMSSGLWTTGPWWRQHSWRDHVSQTLTHFTTRATFVADANFVSWTQKNVSENIQEYFLCPRGAQQCCRVLPRAGNIVGHNFAPTMCPRFSGA